MIPIRQRIASPDPRFVYLKTDDGSLTLEDVATGNTFHSGCGAVAECSVVYANNSQVTAGLAAGKPQRVLELGFGTGLAFLVTASLAKRFGTFVEYVSFEQQPLPLKLVEAIFLSAQLIEPVEPALTSLILEQMRRIDGSAGFHREMTTVIEWPQVARLTVHRNDLRGWRFDCDDVFDAIYFDPFDPATNPELWTLETLRGMYQRLVPGGRLTSYCVKSDVRRRLMETGFAVSKVPGPVGGKREVLVAERPAEDG